MSLLRAVIDHFVVPSSVARPAGSERFAPPDEALGRACTELAPCAPPVVAVLSTAADAQPLGTGVALAMAGRRRSSAALACVWTADADLAAPRWRAPAVPAARRLAAALGMRGCSVHATGRLVIVALAAPPEVAAEQARRALAASGDAPVVLALGGPRVASLDRLLFDQELVVVAASAGADPALARLAALDLASGRGHVRLCEVVLSPATRALAVAGLVAPACVRRALDGPVPAPA